jgi:hypothetical protein
MTLKGYSGTWGKLIHEKNLKSKISWHCPFNVEGGWRLVHVLPELLLVHPGLLVLPPLLLLLLPLQVLHPLLHTDVKALLCGLIKRQYLVGPLIEGKPDKCTRYSFYYSTPCRIL